MKTLITLMITLASVISTGQVNMGVLETSKISEKQLADFKKKAIKDNPKSSLQHIQFMVDTFTIEKNKSAYLDEGVNMQGVAGWALEQYDKLMNRIYRLISSSCTPKSKSLLISMQKAWLTYRDQEMKFLEEYYKEDFQGSFGALMLSEELTTRIKERCIVLENWRENKSVIGDY